MNKIKIDDFIKMIKAYQETGREEITLKTNVVVDLLKKIEENEIERQLLFLQKYNLIIRLKQAGVSIEEIDKIIKNTLKK